MAAAERFPRERMITLYGRMPVLEAVLDRRAVIHQIIVARSARGDAIDRILAAAAERGVKVERADASRVTRVSRNGRQDQGVVADVASPGLESLATWLDDHAGPVALLLLDGVTNPANVGMLIRTAVAAGIDGVVLPVFGVPDVGPLVVKASAGVALFAPVLRSPTAPEAAALLRERGVALLGLSADARATLWDTPLPDRVAFVLGNETEGVSHAVAREVGSWCAIPMHGGVESLNVSTAGAVLAFELARRRVAPASPRC